MTLPSSGTISFSQLQSEYVQNPVNSNISFSSFYYGGSKLQANAATDQARSDSSHPGRSSHFLNIPSSGQIKISNFYGKSAYYARQSNVNISGNKPSVSSTSIENEFWKIGSQYSAFFNVVTTGPVSSDTTGTEALTISGSNRSYTTAYIVINHIISGKGGSGGRGQNNGYNGQNGGSALRTRVHTYINNASSVRGGGGGGGGGGVKSNTYNECYCCNTTTASFSGSGGGGGAGGGSGGPAGDSPGPNFRYYGGSGSSGGESGGQGGSGCAYNTVIGNWCSNPGGSGGNYGQNGASGASQGGGGISSGPATSGGRSGYSIIRENGKHYVKVSAGTVLGPEIAV